MIQPGPTRIFPWWTWSHRQVEPRGAGAPCAAVDRRVAPTTAVSASPVLLSRGPPDDQRSLAQLPPAVGQQLLAPVVNVLDQMRQDIMQICEQVDHKLLGPRAQAHQHPHRLTAVVVGVDGQGMFIAKRDGVGPTPLRSM